MGRAWLGWEGQGRGGVFREVLPGPEVLRPLAWQSSTASALQRPLPWT